MITENLAADSNHLSAHEQAVLVHYIKSHNTAMLSTMFIDIDVYTLSIEPLRQQHNLLLKEIIEQDGQGLVLKYIGNAVMAVFAESSAAAHAAIEIQRTLRRINREQPELRARIGIFLGQVMEEGEVLEDDFDGLVNRAVGIGSLVGEGQVLISCAIHERAKSWLQAQPIIDSVHYGPYRLQGFCLPVDIYELFEPGITRCKVPKKGRVRDHSSIYRWLKVAVVLLAIAMPQLIKVYNSAEVWLEQLYPQPLYFADGTPVQLGGQQDDTRRQVLNRLSAGPALIYYSVGQNLRYFAELELERGFNQLQPLFREWSLPSLSLRLSPEQLGGTVHRKELEFELWQRDGNRMQPVAVSLQLQVKRKADGRRIENAFSWTVYQDGHLVAEGWDSFSQLKEGGIERPPSATIWQSEGYSYRLKSYAGRGAFDLTLAGEFTNRTR